LTNELIANSPMLPPTAPPTREKEVTAPKLLADRIVTEPKLWDPTNPPAYPDPELTEPELTDKLKVTALIELLPTKPPAPSDDEVIAPKLLAETIEVVIAKFNPIKAPAAVWVEFTEPKLPASFMDKFPEYLQPTIPPTSDFPWTLARFWTEIMVELRVRVLPTIPPTHSLELASVPLKTSIRSKLKNPRSAFPIKDPK
jgi:hypothetical protein